MIETEKDREKSDEKKDEFSPLAKAFHQWLKTKGEDPLDEARLEDHRVMYAIFVAGAIAQYECTVPMILKYFRSKASKEYVRWVIKTISSTFSA